MANFAAASTNSSSASAASVSTCTNDDNTPLWKHVTRLEKAAGGGGNLNFTCNYCGENFKGSYSRVTAHLLKIVGKGIKKCTKVTDKILAELRKEVEEAALRVKSASAKEVPLPCQSEGTLGGSSIGFRQEMFEPRKRKAFGNSAIEKAFNNSAREELRQEIARMFYSAGLPFHLARNPHYVKTFTMAANSNLGGFVPPGYNSLRTTLLEKERDNVKRLLEPIKQQWANKGISIVNDGWSDPQRRPLINFIAVNESGPMFLKAVNCQGEYKDRFFIANLIKETILEVGPDFVVQVITDNAPVCQAAGIIVQDLYPKIFWTPCVVHTLNLALKNICAAKDTDANATTFSECSWITEIAMDAMVIKVFITTHSMRLHLYNQFVKLKMLAIADTRFASVIIMLKRFKIIKEGLQSLVISDKWSLYREDNPGKAQFVKEKVLNDLWWDKVDYILSFTEPIYEMLRITDTDQPCLHLVYDLWDCMIEKVKMAIYRQERRLENEESSFYDVVHSILVSRWSKSNTPLHCLAHSLNPRYYSHQWLSGGLNRVEPHKDLEITTERKKCIQRFFPNAEERRMVNTEFGMFSSIDGPFNDHDSIYDRGYLDPKLWWSVHGASTPTLQLLATRLLRQPSSSSCSERNWSTYSFINSVKRNKLTPKRAEDLVYVHSNLRLLSRSSIQYKEGECKMWDVGGDAFDSLEVDGAGILEIANLSLDEPDLDWMFLGDAEDVEGARDDDAAE